MKIPAIQLFAVLALAIGLLVSYFPPTQNGAAIWGTISFFLGHVMTNLFEQKDQNGSTGAPAGSDAPT